MVDVNVPVRISWTAGAFAVSSIWTFVARGPESSFSDQFAGDEIEKQIFGLADRFCRVR